VTVPPSLSAKAETLAERIGLAYDHLLGFRFAVNVLLGTTIVWFTVREIGDSNPIWAIASLVAAADPQPGEARRLFRSRLINVAVGCAVGFLFLLFGSGRQRMIPVALALTVLISTYLVRVKTMWRQAPITAAIVIAAGIAGGSTKLGIGRGLHKVAEVLFGCVVGMLVSWLMSRIWLVRLPEERASAA
jgi:uncharacterized membrane protein YccC